MSKKAEKIEVQVDGMIELSDLFGEPRSVTLKLPNGKALEIKYLPEYVSEQFAIDYSAFMRAVNKIGKSEAGSGGIIDDMAVHAGMAADMLQPILVGWNIRGIECSRESVKRLPIATLLAILSAIMTDTGPDPKESENSEPTSGAI